MTLTPVLLGWWFFERKRVEMALKFDHHRVARNDLLQDVGAMVSKSLVDLSELNDLQGDHERILQRLICEATLPYTAVTTWGGLYDLVHPWLATYALREHRSYSFYVEPRLLSRSLAAQQLIVLSKFLHELVPLLSTMHPITISLREQLTGVCLTLQHPELGKILGTKHKRFNKVLYQLTIHELLIDDDDDGTWLIKVN